ncbi:hypothetical protein [Methanocaldococcus sp.]
MEIERRNRKKVFSEGGITIYESENYYFISDRKNENVIPKSTILGEAITKLLGERSVQ